MGGWVMEMTERVPQPGDSFDCGPWHATVLRTDGRHVQEIELRRSAETVSA